MLGTGELGRVLIVLGLIFLFLGIIISLGGFPGWLGNLPGDIRIERENFSFYFPLTTMILLSLLLNLIFRIINYLG